MFDALQNGTANGAAPKMGETSFMNGAGGGGKDQHTGVVSVEYETREGSGKFDHDFKFTQGTLVSK